MRTLFDGLSSEGAGGGGAALEIAALRRQLERHNYLYYVEARPEITDREYDALMSRLVRLEQEHPEFRRADSPSQKVGGEPISGFVQVQHRLPKLSIDKVFEESELQEWDAGLRKSLDREQLEYSLEYKIDGVAISLTWEEGRLVRGATRGNGMVGDDVTENAKVIGGVPLRLLTDKPPRVLEVRGEVLIRSQDFADLQAGQLAAVVAAAWVAEWVAVVWVMVAVVAVSASHRRQSLSANFPAAVRLPLRLT